MNSLQIYSSSHSTGHNKITKSRSSRPAIVKPILRKLHADRSSLDLDRGWDEQEEQQQQRQQSKPKFRSLDYGARDSLEVLDDNGADWVDSAFPAGSRSFSTGVGAQGGSIGSGSTTSRRIRAAAAVGGSIGSVSSGGHRSVRDVSFTLSTKDAVASAGGRAKYASHARSTSGTSHASVATSASGRNGSFVHPFQQTPRTSTPPLMSYANSVSSLDTAHALPSHALPLSLPLPPLSGPAVPLSLDCSPTITEGGDGDGDGDFEVDPLAYSSTTTNQTSTPISASTSTAVPLSASGTASTSKGYFQQSQRPSSLASQRSTSFSDGNHTLRGPTSRSHSGTTPRIAHTSVNQSPSDLPLSRASSAVDLSPSTTAPLSINTPQILSTSSVTSPSPLSPLRTSFDMSGFRLRSRSEIETATLQEQVREARRKFEAKERAKEEKYQRDQVRRRERFGNKDAPRVNPQARKGSAGNTSFGPGSLSSGRNSSSLEAITRPAVPRKSTSATTRSNSNEKSEFSSSKYDSAAAGRTPHAKADDVQFQTSQRRKTAKHKTNGVWTAFMLWLRTRLLKMGRR